MPTQSVELNPEAIAEAQAAYHWYSERNPSAAAAFLAEIDRAIAAIADAPEQWPRFKLGTRRFLLRRFPFSVVYRNSDTAIQVVAIAHWKRKPNYWRTR